MGVSSWKPDCRETERMKIRKRCLEYVKLIRDEAAGGIRWIRGNIVGRVSRTKAQKEAERKRKKEKTAIFYHRFLNVGFFRRWINGLRYFLLWVGVIILVTAMAIVGILYYIHH